MRPSSLALALPFLAAAAVAARTDTGSVFVLPQAPFSNVTVIGVSGEGSVLIDAGTQEELPAVALGGLADGIGTLTVTGSGSKLTTVGDAVTRANALGIGVLGVGTVAVLDGGEIELDGTNNLPGDLAPGLALGIEAGGVGTLLVSGEGSLIEVRNGDANAAGTAVGLAGQGTCELNGGADLRIDTGGGSDSGVTVGNAPGASGLLLASGAGTTIELLGEGRGFTVGNAGSGELELEAGAELTGAQVAFLGLAEGGSGSVRVGDGALLEIAGTNPQFGYGGALNVGLAGSGLLEVVGGHVVLDNQDGVLHGLQIGGALGCGGPCPFTGGSGEVVVGAGGRFDVLGPLAGATVGADGDAILRVTDGGEFVVEDPDGLSGVSVGTSAGSTGSVIVQGASSLLDAGIGLIAGLDLSFADAGVGTLRVEDGGTLQADFITLGAEGLLAGNGSVVGDVSNLRGTVAPGGSVGSLSVDGSLESGGTLHVELAGTAPGSHDVLQTSGALALTGGEVAVDLLGGFLPRSGDEIPIGEAAGGASVDPSVQVAYRGAAPGLDFELAVEGGSLVLRALSDAESFGSCQVAHLKAFSKLCKKLFDCRASYAKKSAKDPLGEKRDACLAAGEASFANAYQKAAAKAARKGEACGATQPAAEADDALAAASAELADGIGTGWNPGADRDDDALRAALLAQAGALCGAFLRAESAHTKKRDDARRAAARDRAAQGFLTKAGKALEKASAAGVTYGGPDPGAIGDAVGAASFDAASAAAGVTP